MAKSLNSFRAALLAGWVVLGGAGVLYARFKAIPSFAAWPVLAAFLLAYPFYLVTAFPSVRERFAGNRLPVYLVASTVLPYLATCLGAVPFRWSALVRLAAVALAFGLWYRILPAVAPVDLMFLGFVPLVLLGKYFNTIYQPVLPALKDVVFLGHVALIQIAVMVLLLERRVPDFGYGFVPGWKEVRIGALHFLYFAILAMPLALALKATHFVGPSPLWKIAATFVGFLWVVALSEEFFFRGVLLHWIEEWTTNASAALLITSAVFGLVHLGFRGFPNWRWVLIAAVLGWFCGRARNQAGSIRAGMVTHALVFTTWRAFFA